MATQTQGGLGQASAGLQAPPTASVDVPEVAKPVNPMKAVVDDVVGQREALNEALLRMRQSLDERKNRLFDPVLMQAAAGFLKPTKTGSFGESLGYAAENAGVASEREMLHQRENQKMEAELAGKEMELRQQLGGDQMMKSLLQGQPGSAAGQPAGQSTAPSQANPQQVLMAAQQGRIKVTDEVLLLANRVNPKLLPVLQEMRKSQEGEEKNAIERQKLETTTRKVIPRGLRTEREMTAPEYAEYQAALKQYLGSGDDVKYHNFLDNKGWLESEQVRGRPIPKAGETGTAIPSALSATQQKGVEETSVATAKERATAAEQKATKLSIQADASFENTNIAKDMIGYAKNNPLVFDIMNRPGLGNAIARAVEQGATAGNFNVSLPASVIKQYELSSSDLTALQMFMQKNAQLQSRGRQLNRTPGEGSISDYETRLLGGIYALPSDSARAIILKSEALILQGTFDEERFKLWSKKSKDSSFSYNDFLVDDDYKALKSDYRKTLEKVREDNLDLLSPRRKTSAPTKASAPAASAPPGETYTQRLKRLQGN